MAIFARVKRPRAVVVIAIQLVVAVFAIGAWSAASYSVGSDVLGPAVAAASVGMVAYLPITLGVPFLIGNYCRADAGADREVISAALLGTLTTVVILTDIVALLLMATGHVVGQMSALMLVIAGSGAAAISLQQLARIHDSLMDVGIGATAPVLNPVLYTVVYKYFPDSRAHLVVIVGILLFTVLAVVRYLTIAGLTPAVFVDVIASRQMNSAGIRHAFSQSILLVPHLVAISAIMQGLRLLGAFRTDPTIMLETHYIMLVLNGGFTLLASVHALLSPRLQMAVARDVAQVESRNGDIYVVVATTAGIVVVALASGPMEFAFNGFPRLGPGGLGAVALACLALGLLYVVSAVCVRVECTFVLSIASASCAVVLFTLGHLLPLRNSADLAVYYGICFGLMSLLLLLVVRIVVPRAWFLLRSGRRALLALCTGIFLVGALVILLPS